MNDKINGGFHDNSYTQLNTFENLIQRIDVIFNEGVSGTKDFDHQLKYFLKVLLVYTNFNDGAIADSDIRLSKAYPFVDTRVNERQEVFNTKADILFKDLYGSKVVFLDVEVAGVPLGRYPDNQYILDSTTNTIYYSKEGKIHNMGVLQDNTIYLKTYSPEQVLYKAENNEFIPIASSDKTKEFIVTRGGGILTYGSVFPEGMNIAETMRYLFTQIQYPTIVNPTVTLSNNAGTREIGESISLTLTMSINKGAINGKLVNGLWDSAVKQNDRAGATISSSVDGTTGTSKTINNYLVKASNSFTGNVVLGEGPQPLDSNNEPYSTKYDGGTFTPSTSFNGGLRRFAGSMSSVPTTGAQVRTSLLSSSVINTANTFSFTTGTTNKVFVIAIPNTKTLSAVKNTGTNEDLIFSLSGIVTVPDANGTAQPYKVYILENTIPFSTNYTLNVILR